MKLNVSFLLAFAAFVATQAIVQASQTINSDYIIITDNSISAEAALNKALSQAQSSLRRATQPKLKQHVNLDDADDNNDETSRVAKKGKKSKQFGLVNDLTEADKEAIQAIPGVISVIPNSPIELAILDTSIVDSPRILQSSTATEGEITTQWNLDRVDQEFGRDGRYIPAAEGGVDVDVYILDTGVRGDHVAFGGRVLPGMNALVTDSQPGNDDCHGHGTHVASTAAGDIYGIARNATIIPVKILECDGRGSLMGMLNGVSWVQSSITQRGTSRKAVVNLSIQAGANDVIDSLVRTLYSTGAVVVVAAANFNSDACNYSPAREPQAVTVGATSDDDSRLSSSNYGNCVDLFAPGDSIVGAGIVSATSQAVKRGTSMASPLVAGIAATLRQRFPKYTNQQIIQTLLSITKPLPKLVNDLDCSGSLEGKKFAQTLSAQDRRVTLDDPVQLASGIMLQGEFMQWAPELSPKPVNGEICVSFSARVSTARAPVSAAAIRIALATAALPIGIVNFMESSLQCKDVTNRWYVVDSVGEDTRSMKSKIWDFQGNALASVGRQALAELSLTEEKQFYVSVKQSDSGLSLEFGSGDGASERTRFPLVSALDSIFRGTLESLSRISFSSNSNFDILYKNIQPCTGVEEVIPTPAPTPVDNGAGGDVPPARLAVTKPNRNLYTLWPAGWAKPQLSDSSCFQFKAPITKAGKIFVGLANQALGSTRFDRVPSGAHAHSLALTRNTVQLYRDGQLINSQYIVPPIKLPKKGAAQTVFKVEALNDGTITISRKTGDTYTELYQFTDPAGFMGTRFSLASSTVRTFTNVAICNIGV